MDDISTKRDISKTLLEAIEINRQNSYEADKGFPILLEAAAEALKVSPVLDLQIWPPIQQSVGSFSARPVHYSDINKAGLPLWVRRIVHAPLLNFLVDISETLLIEAPTLLDVFALSEKLSQNVTALHAWSGWGNLNVQCTIWECVAQRRLMALRSQLPPQTLVFTYSYPLVGCTIEPRK